MHNLRVTSERPYYYATERPQRWYRLLNNQVSVKQSRSYHIFAAQISDECKVVGIIYIAVAHEQQIFFAYNLLNASWHLVAKQTFLLSLVYQLCQLLEAVLSLSHAVNSTKQCSYNSK